MNTLTDVVEAVATETGLDPIDLPPLYDAIDPDVVESFVQTTAGRASIEFEYCERIVSVDANGDVETRPVAERRTT